MFHDRTMGELCLDDVETTIALQAWLDDDFRRRLIADPKSTIEAAIGRKLPPDLRITIHEETPQHRHLVIPATPALDA